MAGKRVFDNGRELSASGGVIPVRCGALLLPGQTGASPGDTSNRFSSRSRPVLPAEIPGGFSSSLPPPSFPRGRSATFVSGGAAPGGPGLRSPGPPCTSRADFGRSRREADRGRRFRHRRTGRGPGAVDAAARVTLFEAGKPLRRPQPYRRRSSSTAPATVSTRASWCSTSHLPAAHPAVRRARRRDGGVGDVVLGPGPRRRARMERLEPRRGVRPARQTSPGRPSGGCWRTCCASTGWPPALARESGTTAELDQPIGDFLGGAPLLRRVPRLVLPADDRLHLVVPDRADAALPGRDPDPLLPQPRPAADQRPAALAHRARRLGPLRGADARIDRRCPGRDGRAPRPPPDGRRRSRCRPTTAASASTAWCWPATATRRWPCWPTRAKRSRRSSERSATSRTGRSCTPTPASCRGAGRPGRPGTTSARRAPTASRPRSACTT